MVHVLVMCANKRQDALLPSAPATTSDDFMLLPPPMMLSLETYSSTDSNSTCGSPPPSSLLVTKIGKFNLKPSTGVGVQKGNNVHNNRVAVLPEIPSFVEKTWSFFVVDQTIDSICNEMSEAFSQIEFDVDYTLNEDSSSFHGAAYFFGHDLVFQINFFQRCDSDDRILVEFQRMSGNALMFGRFFSACAKFLTSVFGGVQPFDGSTTLPSYEKSCSRSETLMNYFDADVRIDSMLWMLSARSIENRREGLTSLTIMSYIPENISVMCRKDALQTVIASLVEDDCWEMDMQQVRLLSTLFANLSASSDFLENFLPLDEVEQFILRCDALVQKQTDEQNILFSSHVSEILRQLSKVKSNCSIC
jgi:hypothetical protein